MDQNTLNDLIASCKRNDGNAFRQLVECHQPMIYSLAYRLLCNEEEAKDAVQETFIRVWMNLHGFDTSRKFSTWVYAIATNLCYDKLKSSRHFARSLPLEMLNEVISNEDVEKRMIDSELGALIATLTDELTPKQKIVFTDSVPTRSETSIAASGKPDGQHHESDRKKTSAQGFTIADLDQGRIEFSRCAFTRTLHFPADRG